jgi:hypothetical protein
MSTNKEDGTASRVTTGRRKRLTRWLNKHKKAVTVLSALTVLVSFIVKEALDEPAKDLLGSIGVAERDNNQEQSGLFNELIEIAVNLQVVRDKILENKATEEADLQLRELLADHQKIMEGIGENIGHLIVLKSVLPAAFQRDEEDFENKYQAQTFPWGHAPVDVLKKSENEWHALYDDSRILRGKGVHELEELKDQTEFNHKMYLWLAYVSFGAGWIVGLVSNLVGKKAESAAE